MAPPSVRMAPSFGGVRPNATLRCINPGGCGGTGIHTTTPSLAGSAVSTNGTVVVVEVVDELVVEAVALVVVVELVVEVEVELVVVLLVEVVVEVVVNIVRLRLYLSLSPLESPNTNAESTGVLTPLLISS